MGRRKRKYTEEELYIKELKKDKEVFKIVKCKGCRKIYPLMKHYVELTCSCGKKIITLKSINYKSAELIYERK